MSTTLTVADGPKMLREALCVAEHAVNRNIEPQNQHGAPRILAALIAECDRHRPLGPDGKHGDRHTDTCGCDDMPLDPSKVKAGDTVTVTKTSTGTEVKGRVSAVYDAGGDAWDVGIDGLGPTMRIPGLWEVTAHQPGPKKDPRELVVDILIEYSNARADDYATADRIMAAVAPNEPRPLPTRDDLARVMHDDYLPNGEPRLGRTHREILADAVLAHLRGESR